MALQQQLPDGSLRLRWVRADAIGINDDSFAHSLLLTPERVQAWAPASAETVDDAALQPVIELAPQVFILGTGARQRFLQPRLMAQLMRAGIGIECMDNAAAARTFNLLADEGRKVLGGFLLPG